MTINMKIKMLGAGIPCQEPLKEVHRISNITEIEDAHKDRESMEKTGHGKKT